MPTMRALRFGLLWVLLGCADNNDDNRDVQDVDEGADAGQAAAGEDPDAADRMAGNWIGDCSVLDYWTTLLLDVPTQSGTEFTGTASAMVTMGNRGVAFSGVVEGTVSASGDVHDTYDVYAIEFTAQLTDDSAMDLVVSGDGMLFGEEIDGDCEISRITGGLSLQRDDGDPAAQ